MILLRPSHVVFYAAVVTLTVTLAVGSGFWFIRRQMLAGNDFLLDAESKEALARIEKVEPPMDAAKLEAVLKEHTTLDEGLFYFQVHEPAGRVIYQSPNLGAKSLTDLTGGLDKRTLNLPPLGLLRVAEYHTPTIHLQLAMSLENFKSVNDSFVRVFLLGVPLIGLLCIWFGMALRRSTLRPLLLIQTTARRIGASNLSERIPVPADGGEMSALARLLNEMIDRLEKSFNHVKRFTADTSHELMTPLSVIRLHAEKLLNDPELPSKHRHSVEELQQETLHLSETLERLLTLAKADSTVLPIRLQPVAIQEFMQQFGEDAQLLAESRHLKASLVVNEPGVIHFDRGWIRQVLFNLLSNALRFSPPAGTIQISSRCEQGNWIVEISDEGPGVPPDRLGDIFERFVQITPRSEPGHGSGLGLAICKSIVELHKGRIDARNRSDRSGLSVTFCLPAMDAND